MVRRVIYAYALLMASLFIAALGTGSAVLGNETYIEAVGRQSTYAMTVSTPRRTVYDRNLTPLTNAKQKYIAAVIPNVDTIGELQSVTDESKHLEIYSALENGSPFLIETKSPLNTDGIKSFSVFERYGDPQPAANLIGYLQNGKNGVSGIEKYFDDELRCEGDISVTFTVDALGHAIQGAVIDVADTAQQPDGGIALTIDRSIQTVVESSCSDILTGAAVVMKCYSGEVLALASFPAVNANDLDKSLETPGDPFINRALSAYSPGSVFKLIPAAAALEDGADFREIYSCSGSIEVDGMHFSCFDGTAHGNVNLHTALRQSCNGYFIHLVQEIGAETVLNLAQKLSMGEELSIWDGFSSDPGTLPDADDLTSPRALANFSFGQGEITLTPLHTAALVNMIASDGIYYPPQIYLGSVDEDMMLSTPQVPSEKKIIGTNTASKLQSYMESTARFGTARIGTPTNCRSGIKTGTAQTGVCDEAGNEKQNYWYAGYICNEEGTPVYTVVLLEESYGESHVPEAFKKIAETLADFT